jgi:hypothetical protein
MQCLSLFSLDLVYSYVIRTYNYNIRTYHQVCNICSNNLQHTDQDRLTNTIHRRFNVIMNMAIPPIENCSDSSLNITNTNENDITISSRRDLLVSLWKIPLGTIGLYAYGRILYNTLSSNSITNLFSSPPIYPIEHEQHVATMIQTAFSTSLQTKDKTSSNGNIFRVLEVGIGTDARLIRRGLYNNAIHEISNQSNNIKTLEIIGLDVQIPTEQVILHDMNNIIQQIQDRNGIDLNVTLSQASITSPLEQYPDSYFDTVICCFTLCSVNDPIMAVRSMKRLVRSNSGTFGYVEHVAVEDTDHQLLSIEQQVFDPIQHFLADNCHLHRTTETTIDTVFADDTKQENYSTIYRERYYVDGMWPVSCQACGVIQLA